MAVRYDTRCYFNVRSKVDMSQLNLPHGCLIYHCSLTADVFFDNVGTQYLLCIISTGKSAIHLLCSKLEYTPYQVMFSW